MEICITCLLSLVRPITIPSLVRLTVQYLTLVSILFFVSINITSNWLGNCSRIYLHENLSLEIFYRFRIFIAFPYSFSQKETTFWRRRWVKLSIDCGRKPMLPFFFRFNVFALDKQMDGNGYYTQWLMTIDS